MLRSQIERLFDALEPQYTEADGKLFEEFKDGLNRGEIRAAEPIPRRSRVGAPTPGLRKVSCSASAWATSWTFLCTVRRTRDSFSFLTNLLIPCGQCHRGTACVLFPAAPAFATAVTLRAA